MSGLIGKLSFDDHEPLARPVLDQMLDAVTHGGDPGRDIYAAPGIALGGAAIGSVAHTRVVADAQLSNVRELRAQLRRQGHDVSNASTAELIASAYLAWGERCAERLEGAFACAIWDARERRLVLARDAIGVRPLYFAFLHGHGVVFASEVRALFCDPGVTREYAPAAINAYLTLGYVPAPLTAFRRISKVEPGQYISIEGRRLRAEQYWDLPATGSTGTLDDTLRLIDNGLRMAARAEGPDSSPAVLYSGGTASSALLAALPQGLGTPILVAIDHHTSQLVRAHDAAQCFGRTTDFEEAPINASTLGPALAARLDEPIADPFALTHYATAIAARQHSDSAITGLGATALFEPAARHTVWDGEHRRALYTRAFAWQVRDTDPRSRFHELSEARASRGAAERAMYVEVRSVLAESTLMIADRARAAAGLALHAPYLNRHFVELAAAIPMRLKAAGQGPLPLLRRLLATRLPDALMPPAGASARVPAWLEASLPALVPSVLLAPRFDGRGIISRPALRALWDEHQRGRRDHSLRFWSLLMLEFWFREQIDGDAAEAPLEYAVLKAA